MLTIYSKPNCTFCDQAKALLERKGVPFKVVDVTQDKSAYDMLVDAGLRNVPQIYNGTHHLPGGFQGLASKDEQFFESLKG